VPLLLCFLPGHVIDRGLGMRKALIFGGSGQIGRSVIQLLRANNWHVLALSREPRTDEPGLQWLRGSFADFECASSLLDAVISCGPLDAFAHWFEHAPVNCSRVVAFGSTSVVTKRDSASIEERAIAEKLRSAEDRLFARGTVRAAPVTVLRPTLVYGAGQDLTLTRIAQLAARWNVFALPRHATGLRQPVHVDDLAQAAHACLAATCTFARAYDVPGGERLPYREMVKRVLDALQPRPRLVELPGPMFDTALRAMQVTGRLRGLGAAAVERMREDLVFDAGPACRDFGYAPRDFKPVPSMFGLA
jgi:nucleoside-diphosphate-sugar epimerase